MYPFEKYHYYIAGNKVIATSTYAGKTVRGVAKCAEGDTFDLEKGKRLAALRCGEKVAKKRYERAADKVANTHADFELAKIQLYKANMYLWDADEELTNIERELTEFESTL